MGGVARGWVEMCARMVHGYKDTRRLHGDGPQSVSTHRAMPPRALPAIPAPPRPAPVRDTGSAVDDANIAVFVRARPEIDPIARAAAQLTTGLTPLQVDPECARVTIRTPPRAPVDADGTGGKSGDARATRQEDTGDERAATIGAGGSRGWHTFCFDGVFGDSATNEVVFRTCAAPMVEKLLRGQNVTVFAYGQTGSGKTHTMTGSPGDPGVALRLMEALFASIDEMPDTSRVVMSISAVEVLRKRVFDLLNHDKVHGLKELAVYPSEARVVRAKTSYIDSLSSVMEYYATACERRAKGNTAMNAVSSRTHMLTRLFLEVRLGGETPRIFMSTLTLVDLAGSENVDRSHASGELFTQACGINSDLSALRRVAQALATKAKHIPYHDSTLTRLLRPTLGGNARAVMIGTVSGSVLDAHDTLSTLRFAAAVRTIKNHVTVNAFDSIEALRARIVELQRQLSAQACAACEARARVTLRAIATQTEDASPPTSAGGAAAAAAAALAAITGVPERVTGVVLDGSPVYRKTPPPIPGGRGVDDDESSPEVSDEEVFVFDTTTRGATAGAASVVTPGQTDSFGLSVDEASDLYAQLDTAMEDNEQLRDHVRELERGLASVRSELEEERAARASSSAARDDDTGIAHPGLRIELSAEEVSLARQMSNRLPTVPRGSRNNVRAARARVRADAGVRNDLVSYASKEPAPMPVDRADAAELPPYTARDDDDDENEEEDDSGDDDEKGDDVASPVRSFVDQDDGVPSRPGRRGSILLASAQVALPPVAEAPESPTAPPVPPPPPPPVVAAAVVAEPVREEAVVACDVGAFDEALREARRALEEQRGELETMRAECEARGERVRALEREARLTEDRAKADGMQATRRVEQLERQLAEARRAEVAATLRASSMASECAQAQARVRAAEARDAEYHTRVAALQERVAATARDNDALSRKAVELATSLRNAERDAETFAARSAAFAGEAKRARDNAATAQTVTTQTISTLRVHLEELRRSFTALQNDNARMRLEGAKMEGDIRGLLDAGAKTEMELREAKSALGYLRDRAQRVARDAAAASHAGAGGSGVE